MGMGSARSYTAEVEPRHELYAALIGGVVASLPFGVVLQLNGSMHAAGIAVGFESAAIGWLVLLAAGMLGGVVFANVWQLERFTLYAEDHLLTILFGFAYGFLAWFVGIAVMFPLWLRLLGFGAPFPYLTVVPLLGLVVYGVTLGALYPVLTHGFAAPLEPGVE